MNLIASIDIGGTSIKYGVVDSANNEFTYLGKIDTDTHLENFRMEERLETVMMEILKNHDISGIAISTAGIVDTDRGMIIHANKNIPHYKGTCLKEILESQYDVPVSVENDVNAALLGEVTFGAFKSVHSAIMLTIGTGVGGALYLNKDIYRGFSYSVGEAGYSLINNHKIEESASTTALVENVKRRTGNLHCDGEWIFDQAINHHNKICIEEIDNLVADLTQLIITFVSLINPEVVILGGGIMEQTDYLNPLFRKKFDSLYSNTFVAQQTKISFASLGNKAGVLGAYSHFKKMNEELNN